LFITAAYCFKASNAVDSFAGPAYKFYRGPGYRGSACDENAAQRKRDLKPGSGSSLLHGRMGQQCGCR
jgi:hypothetical protein